MQDENRIAPPVSGADIAQDDLVVAPPRPVFLQGSILRHTLSMTAMGAVGLFAIFVVDLVNIIYVGMLNDATLTAAVGFASTAFFLLVSVGIGISIAGTALVSRALGKGRREKAHRIATAFLGHAAVAGIVSSALMAFAAPTFLSLMGAQGQTASKALVFLWISLPSATALMLGMATTGLLRAVGDGRRAMHVTLAGAVSAAALDPVVLFVFDWGIEGVALVGGVARVAMMAAGFYFCIVNHGLLTRFAVRDFKVFTRPIWGIAVPAVLTNVATPIANSYVTAKVAPFGDAAVAGLVMITRLIPVVFGALFALSGAIGPILGQNLGAGAFDRVRSVLSNALLVCGVYTVSIWPVMMVLEPYILRAMGATGEAASLVSFFIVFITLSWIFHGASFVSNAAFNTLGYPALSTAFNWGKTTVGTMPFVALGALWYGARGALVGQAIGAVTFGIAGVVAGYWVINRLERQALKV